MQLFGGLDIGTNGVRIVLVDETLKIYYENSLNYETKTPREGWAEQDPEEIYQACQDLLTQVVKKYIDEDIYITFSSVMHSIMVVDEDGCSLTPMIIWADTRGRDNCQNLGQKYGNNVFYKNTACPLHSTYWPSRILYLKNQVQDLNNKKFVSIKEYIIYQLINDWKVDRGLVSTSGIFNLKQGNYDSEILNIIGISEEKLSAIVPTSDRFRFEINGKIITGIMGSTDGVLANLGAGAIHENEAVVTAGTSAAVRMTTTEPVFDPEQRVWCYILDGDYYVSGEAINGAGLLIKWLAEIFDYKNEIEMDIANIPELPYQGNDIIFIPTLMGERGPNYNESLRGLSYGLSLNHTRQDIIIAFYESIALFLKMVYNDVLRVCKEKIDTKIMTGGLGLSDPFSQLLSYLIGEIDYLPGHSQNTAIGAAMMGIKVINGISYQKQIDNLPERAQIVVEKKEDFKIYLDDKYKRFTNIYEKLINNFDVI